MGYAFRREVPIYLQLIEIIKNKMIDGSYHAGDRLPSIREMALEYDVTPNTIQRALNVLEQEGIILTERTNGKYITSDSRKLIELRSNHLNKSVQELVDTLLASGYTRDEIRKVFQERMERNEDWH